MIEVYIFEAAAVNMFSINKVVEFLLMRADVIEFSKDVFIEVVGCHGHGT